MLNESLRSQLHSLTLQLQEQRSSYQDELANTVKIHECTKYSLRKLVPEIELTGNNLDDILNVCSTNFERKNQDIAHCYQEINILKSKLVEADISMTKEC